jgi:Protein of unknown function (DUF3592)
MVNDYLNSTDIAMNKKTALLILMLAAAVIFTIASLSVRKSLITRKNGVETESVVQNSGPNSKGSLRTVTVTFKTIDGKAITAAASTRQFLKNGESVKIWYDQSTPVNIDFGDTVKYNMRGVIIGGLIFLFGFYFFVKFSIQDLGMRNLKKNGRKVQTEFVAIDKNERYRMGENNPWVIKSRWTDESDNKEYQFSSPDYIIDPAPYLKGRTVIDVFINPSDPLKYYMDTSFMPRGNNTIG